MSDPIITLTTDFGEGSPYVATMKGVVVGINPAARLLDLTHRVPPQDVRHAAFFLAGRRRPTIDEQRARRMARRRSPPPRSA